MSEITHNSLYHHGYHVAFISENVRDFASSTRNEFRPQLQEDVKAINVIIDYYPSLEAFIEKQAKPISHVTAKWVEQRIDLGQIHSMIERHLDGQGYSWRRTANYFTISDERLRQLYAPVGTPRVYQLDVNLEGVQVFEFDEAHIEASLDFYVYTEADIDCHLVDSATRYSRYEGTTEEGIGLLGEQTLVCTADLQVFVSARISGETVEILEIEDVVKG